MTVSRTWLTRRIAEYSARSFNFAITPWFRSENFQAELIAKTVSRTYSFSHDILKQLRTHGWDHNEAWERGVPYLTCYEAQTVEERFLQPWESKTPLNVNKLDVESKKFRNWAYDQITSWLKTEVWGHLVLFHLHHLCWLIKLIHAPSSTIQDKTLDLATPSGKRFTSLQVGLVCQLVHSRFDECRATPKDDHRVMHIKKLGRPELTKEVSGMKFTSLGLFTDILSQRLASRRTALTRQSGMSH